MNDGATLVAVPVFVRQLDSPIARLPREARMPLPLQPRFLLFHCAPSRVTMWT